MAQADFTRGANDIRQTAAASYAANDIIQLADGRAGVYVGVNAAAAGDLTAWRADGQWSVVKTAAVVGIDGGPAWWDGSGATPVPQSSGRGFFLGTFVGDAAAADARCTVNLNVRPAYLVDLHRDGGESVIVAAAGRPHLYSRGGALGGGFDATAEAQKFDWLSRRSWPAGAPWVLEARLAVVTDADIAGVVDLNVGVANGTHPSDADLITEAAVFHLDPGDDPAVRAASRDGTRAVAATDTARVWAVGTPLHLVIDGRNPAALRFYVDGVRVLAATVFDLSAAAGPLKALWHVEKSADDSPGVFDLLGLGVRLMGQSNAA